MENKQKERHDILTVMHQQLDKVIAEMQDLNEEDLVYYEAIRKIISFKLNEDEVKRQFTKINDMMIAMGKLDFSRRIKVGKSKDLFSFLGSNLNFLNEELEDKVIPKIFLEHVMDKVMTYKPDFALLTTVEGKIKYVSNNPESLIGFNKEELLDNRIQNFFATNIHFKITEEGIFGEKEVDLLTTNSDTISVLLAVEEIPDEYFAPYYLYMFKLKEAAV